MKSPYVGGREIRLDIKASDSEGNEFHQGKPIYHIDKVVREIDEEYADGSNVIFVNGTYKGDDEIGKLVHDFSCKDSRNMYYQPLADGVKHVKGTKKGRESMCEAVESYAEKYGNKVAEQTKVNIVKNLMSKMNWTIDEALSASGIEGVERTVIAKQLQS